MTDLIALWHKHAPDLPHVGTARSPEAIALRERRLARGIKFHDDPDYWRKVFVRMNELFAGERWSSLWWALWHKDGDENSERVLNGVFNWKQRQKGKTVVYREHGKW